VVSTAPLSGSNTGRFDFCFASISLQASELTNKSKLKQLYKKNLKLMGFLFSHTNLCNLIGESHKKMLNNPISFD
jgi:hypothetical protein